MQNPSQPNQLLYILISELVQVFCVFPHASRRVKTVPLHLRVFEAAMES